MTESHDVLSRKCQEISGVNMQLRSETEDSNKRETETGYRMNYLLNKIEEINH